MDAEAGLNNWRGTSRGAKNLRATNLTNAVSEAAEELKTSPHNPNAPSIKHAQQQHRPASPVPRAAKELLNLQAPQLVDPLRVAAEEASQLVVSGCSRQLASQRCCLNSPTSSKPPSFCPGIATCHQLLQFSTAA